MTTHGTIRLAAIFKMLDHCAQGHERRATDHRYQIRFQGKMFPLPKGGHGRESGAEIEKGHVKRMARFLGIQGCAGQMLPQLGL